MYKYSTIFYREPFLQITVGINMVRSLYALALSSLLQKYSCEEIRKYKSDELSKIRLLMRNNHKFLVNYRTPECLNQLHYFTDTPGSILEMIDNKEEIWEIGMQDLDYY